MCVHAISIAQAEDLTFRILNEILSGSAQPCARRVKFGEIGKAVGTSEEVVRYNVRKLVRMGYLRSTADGYEPTGKVLFIPESGDENPETSKGKSPKTGN